MAVLVCSACGKRYSSIAGKCPHCGTDPDADMRDRRRRQSGIGPSVNYMLAILVSVGGAAWFYSALVNGRDTTYAQWMVGAGLIWYVVARLWAAVRRL